MVKVPTTAVTAATTAGRGLTVIGLAGMALNEILKSQGITSRAQSFFLDPIGLIVEEFIDLFTRPKQKTIEEKTAEWFEHVMSPEVRALRGAEAELERLAKIDLAEAKAAKAAYLARKGEMASSKRQEATSNIKVVAPKLVQQEYTAPQVQPETKLPTQTDYASNLLSQQARSREMADDALATRQNIASARSQLESERNLLTQKRNVISAETAAIKNLASAQQAQINTVQKQKEEAEQAVIQNEIQQRLKNLSATSQQPIVNTTKPLPPSVSVVGRGNKILIKVMNDFGMTKAEAKRYIKKYGID